MSDEQLSALLANHKDDAGLQETFKSATDLDAAGAIAKEASICKDHLQRLEIA